MSFSIISSVASFDPQKAKKKYDEISLLDPIGMDSIVHQFPMLSKSKDVAGLLELLKQLSDNIKGDVLSYTYEEAMAIFRDLGIPLGSIKRHGVEPLDYIVGLGDKMELLGKILNSVPRNNIIQYSLCNPKGVRERKHTDTVDESRLLESIRMSLPKLEEAIVGMDQLYNLSITSDEFSILAKEIEENYSSMIEAVVYAHKYISPVVFAQEIRFYFDPVKINGVPYMGPGAVEMPTLVFDHILWSNECTQEFYREFKLTYLPYFLPYFKSLYYKYESQPSLLTKVASELNGLHSISEATQRSLKTLMNLFNILISFRTPHKKIAERTYAESAEGERETGSGGYDPSILTRILDLSILSKSRCKALLTSAGIG